MIKRPRVDDDTPDSTQPADSPGPAAHLFNTPCQGPNVDQAQEQGVIFPIPAELPQNPKQRKEGSARLLEAARKGNVKQINKLLNQGIDVNADYPWGVSALAVAVAANKEAAVAALVSRGANVNARLTVSAATIRTGHPSTKLLLMVTLVTGVQLLVHAGASRC